MHPTERPALFLVAVLVAILVGSAITLWIGRVRRIRRGRAAARRGAWGERRARRLLERAGYSVLGAQVEAPVTLRVNGAEQTHRLKVDYLVAKKGRRWVAEVKTGEIGSSVTHGPTRRQLLEYVLAFDVDAALLVLPAKGRIEEVEFL